MVDMTADHTIDMTPTRLLGNRLLIFRDEGDGVLDLVFQVGRERPVGQPHAAAQLVEPRIQAEREAVGGVPQQRQPFGTADDAVEMVAMGDHKRRPSAVS